MARIDLRLFLLSIIALGACVSLFAQSDQSVLASHVKEIPAPLGVEEAASGHVKIIPAPEFHPSAVPFAIDSPNSDTRQAIRIVSEDEMSRGDRDLVANAESSIRERAGFENLEFSGAGWTYRELVCPALPKHLFLRFTRDDDTRQMSMFTAAIPRDGNGRVHIIPIVRKGYSLFSPAPIGAMTIAAFNRIRTEEGAGDSADWLGTGLCYAALAGTTPLAAAAPAEKPGNDVMPVSIPPTLVIAADGGAIIRFADDTAPHPMEWNMIFDRKGKLLKATHSPAYIMANRKLIPKTLGVNEPVSGAAAKQP